MLRNAEHAIAELSGSTTFDQFSDHWFMFLTAWKAIWTYLEQGAKTPAASLQWFKAKKIERTGDPMLRYLSAARNNDHHGLKPVLQMVNAEAVFAFPDGPLPAGTEVSYSIEQGVGVQTLKVSRSDGGPVEHVSSREGPFVALQYVRDQKDRVVPLPGRFMGEVINDGEPLEIARLALGYAVKMVSEAEALCTP